MRRRPVVLAIPLALIVVAVLYVRAGAAGGGTSFRTADAGAACRVEGPALVCGSLGADRSLELRAGRTPRVVPELPWWDASTPVLRRFTHGGIACSLRRRAIVCRSGATTIRVDRGGFAVAL